MDTHIIYVYGGYIDGARNKELELSDRGYSLVEQGMEIEWVIDNQPERFPGSIAVTSLDDVKYESGNRIFKINPRRDQDNKVKGQIDTGLGAGKRCKYFIRWTGENNRTYKFDPIIAVKPVMSFDKRILLAVVVAVGALISLQFFRKKRRKDGLKKFSTATNPD